jgi:hypothetical protein
LTGTANPSTVLPHMGRLIADAAFRFYFTGVCPATG